MHLFAAALFLLLPALAAGLRALGIFPITVHSHNSFFQVLMRGLADRGHEVVMVSPFPLEVPRANYTDVDLSIVLPPIKAQFELDLLRHAKLSIPLVFAAGMVSDISERFGENMCRTVFSYPEFQDVVTSGQIDVVLTEVLGSDCFAAVSHKLGVPLVGVSSLSDMPWLHERIGSSDNPSYLHYVFSHSAGGKMSFFERLFNTADTLLSNYLHRRFMQDASDAIVQEFFGEDMPPLREIVKNTSLMIVNRHISIFSARPVTPSTVYAGGMHMKPPEPLDAELDAWMRSAEHGVVVFALGSMVREASIDIQTRDALLRAFAAIPQRVIWKFESDDIPELPPNVRMSRWMPQRDILAHPNTILFITHGGLMSTLEALDSGVPMLGMPLFGDQMSNINLFKSLGIAEEVDLNTLSMESFLSTLKKMTEEERYRAQAKVMSARFSDRPRGALEEAVWWVEYVVRHRGAPHLRPLGADLPLHEYLLLDVAAVAILSVAVLVAVIALVTRMVLPGFLFLLQRIAPAAGNEKKEC